MGFWVVVVPVCVVLLGGWFAAGGNRVADGPGRWLPPTVAAGWVAWGLWETYVVGPDDNIRVDLVLFVPVIAVATVVAIVVVITTAAERAKRSRLPPPEGMPMAPPEGQS